MGLRLILLGLMYAVFAATCLGVAYGLDPSPQNLETMKVLAIGGAVLVATPIVVWKLLPNLEG